jgi:hypothetical protein
MPWFSCTTGSPIFSSERSRSQPSRLARRASERRPIPRGAGGGGVELVFGDDGEVIQDEATGQRTDAEHEALRAARKPAKSTQAAGSMPYSAR